MTPLLLLLAGLANAQEAPEEGTFDARGRQVAASDGDLKDPLIGWRAERQQAGAIGLSALFEYAEKPLVVYQNDQGEITGGDMLDDLAGVNLMGSFGLHERVAVTASIPVWLTSASLDSAQGLGAGDLRLTAPIGLVMPRESGGFGLSLVPMLDVPTGSTKQFLGNRGVSGGGVAALGVSGSRWSLDGNLGARFTPEVENALNITGGPQLLASLGGAALLDDHHALRAELVQRSALQGSEVANTQSPSEAMLSGRGRYDSGLNWTLGGALGLSPGAGSAQFRIYAGIGYTLGKDRKVVLPARLIVEVVDQDGRALRNAHLMVDSSAQQLEPDATWEANRLDPESTVAVAATLPGYSPAERAVTLVEGDNTVRLQLQELPGSLTVKVVDEEGKPLDARVAIANDDGDRRGDPAAIGDDGEWDTTLPAGSWRIIAEADGYGIGREDVTLPRGGEEVVELVLKTSKVTVTQDKVLILEKVHFAFDQATVLPESMPLLEEVADTLLAHPELLLVEVGGHTDARGDATYNQQLSQRRVETVRRHLIDRGVEASRLTAKGYGESALLESGESEAAHAANRRVEFTIIEREKE